MAENTTVHADYAAASALAKYPFEPVSSVIRGQQQHRALRRGWQRNTWWCLPDD